MADHLTIKGDGGTPRQAQGSQQGPSRADDDLERLKAIAKERHAKHLDDKTLRAIVARHKAKKAHQAKINESKETFETQKNKEAFGNKAADAQSRAMRTTGAKQARGADGLTNEERDSIRSDPKSGPRLPPTSSRATTPEQSKHILEKVLSTLVGEDGLPLDFEAYAKNLKPKPPSRPAGGGKTRSSGGGAEQGKAAGAKSRLPTDAMLGKSSSALRSGASKTASRGPAGSGAGDTGAGRAGDRGGAIARGGTPGQRDPLAPGHPGRAQGSQSGAAKGPGTSPGPLPMGREMSSPAAGRGAGMAPPTASSNLAFRAGNSMRTSTGVSPEGLFNAGGGLITGSSFDGMHFNWDAFFALFLIRTQKDAQLWRKILKQLKRLEHELSVDWMKTDIVMTELRQKFQERQVNRQLFQLMSALPRNIVQAQVNRIGGTVDPAKLDKAKNELKELLAGTEFGGRAYLTEGELDRLSKRDAALAQQYRERRESLERAPLGKVGMLGVMIDDLSRVNDASALRKEIESARDALAESLQQLMPDNLAAAMLNNVRGAYSGKANAAKAEKEAVKNEIQQLRATPDSEERRAALGDAESRLESARQKYDVSLAEVAILDRAMADAERGRLGDERAKKYKDAYEEIHRQVQAAENGKAIAEEMTSLFEGRDELDQVSPESSVAGAERADAVDSYLSTFSQGGEAALQPQQGEAALERAVKAGSYVARARDSIVYPLERDRQVDMIGQLASGIPMDASFQNAVNNAVQNTISLAKQESQAVNGMLRAQLSKSQGMINQLVQLLAMSRSA